MAYSRITKDGSALRIAIIYAIFAAAWILLSDLLIAPFSESRAFIILSIIKGWLFVAVTSVLLYFLVERAVENITNTQAQMHLLFDSIDDGIYLFQIDRTGQMGSIIDINEGALRQTGYSRSELLNTTPPNLVPQEHLPTSKEATEQLLKDGQVLYETVLKRKDGYEFPIEINSRILRIGGNTIGVAVARDLTERKRVEEERRQSDLVVERDKRKFYRETIMAVTGGKFELCEPEDQACLIENPGFIADFSEPEQVSKVRNDVMDYCRSQGLSEDLSVDFELAVGEAIANATKHSNGGRIEAGRKAVDVWVAVIDHGTGIDTFSLPKVALVPGYTTKASMGLGYTIMLEVSDRVSLATGPSGTIVVLEKRLKPVSDVERRIDVHGGIK